MSFLKKLFAPKTNTERNEGFQEGYQAAKIELFSGILDEIGFIEEAKTHQSERSVRTVPALVYVMGNTGLTIGRLKTVSFGPTSVIKDENREIFETFENANIEAILDVVSSLLREGYSNTTLNKTRFTYVVEDLYQNGKELCFPHVRLLTVPVFNALFQVKPYELDALIMDKHTLAARPLHYSKEATIEMLHAAGLLSTLIEQTYWSNGALDITAPSLPLKQICQLGVYDQNDIYAKPKYPIDYTQTDFAFLKGRLDFLKKKYPEKKFVIDFP